MKRFVLLVTLGLATGLFVAGQALGAGQTKRMQKAQAEGTVAPAQTQAEKAVVPLNVEQIRYLQNILQEKGYDVGNESGEIGPNTTSALQSFQSDEGLAVTGTPDQMTLRALAPSPEELQYFGLAPAFGEEPSEMEQQPMQHEEEPEPEGNGGS